MPLINDENITNPIICNGDKSVSIGVNATALGYCSFALGEDTFIAYDYSWQLRPLRNEYKVSIDYYNHIATIIYRNLDELETHLGHPVNEIRNWLQEYFTPRT